MKKYLALGIISLCSAVSFAQGSSEPFVIPDATARKISTDGKWVCCYGTTILVYNIDTETTHLYPECSLGKGNCIATNGTVVGSYEDYSVVMKDGKIIESPVFTEYEFSGINGINSSATIVTGYVKNPVLKDDNVVDPFEEGYTVFVPIVADITPEGTIEKINFLPYPEKDFLGYAPMYVTGEWISEDGKTIMGTMTDSFGRFEDPIVFNQGSNGEWSYSTPTKEFSNPDGIVLPENPWSLFPNEPNIKDYMTALQYQAYTQAMDNFLFNGGKEPSPYDYMTEAMAQKYVEDYMAYENYFEDHKAEIDAYEKAYREILQTSLYFRDSAMDPQGAFFATAAVGYDDEGQNAPSHVMIFNTQTGEYKTFDSQYSELKVHQILSDGTVLAYTGLFTYDVLKGYILLPGASDFIPFADYLANVNPGYAKWLKETFPKGEGILSASDDLSVIAGGLDVLAALDENMFPNSIILTYVLPDMKGAGVESIEIPVENGVYKVYNLMGVKVLETKEKSDINNLGKGIYIVNGKKIAL